ncbi:MAG TPA: hypothetical protein VFC39_20340 [Acidobacteriaceae bacterium]|nr:hypothetical protein [Acidobacteriaceae bacterium]
MNIAAVYFSYLAISIALTIWVARTLHRNGRIFLVDAFRGNSQLADAVNHLLVVGFYLINIGYISLALKTTEALTTLRQAIELESYKIGVVLLILGIMHVFNIFIFARMRNRGVRPGYDNRPAGAEGVGYSHS